MSDLSERLLKEAHIWNPSPLTDLLREAAALAERTSCRGGDPACPCQDGDPCHYLPYGDTPAMRTPAEQAEARVAAIGNIPMIAARAGKCATLAEAVEDAIETVRREAEARVSALQRENESLLEWKNAVTDAAIVNWTYNTKHTPREAINAMLAQAYREALDPAVSEEAHKLVERAEKAERELEDSAVLLRRLWEILLPLPAESGRIEALRLIEAEQKENSK